MPPMVEQITHMFWMLSITSQSWYKWLIYASPLLYIILSIVWLDRFQTMNSHYFLVGLVAVTVLVTGVNIFLVKTKGERDALYWLAYFICAGWVLLNGLLIYSLIPEFQIVPLYITILLVAVINFSTQIMAMIFPPLDKNGKEWDERVLDRDEV